MIDVKILDFRVTDRVLAQTDPEAGDVVYLGGAGRTAAPFVIARTLAGPGGVYIDACSVVDADGSELGTWERRFELDGESKPRTISTEIRGLSFPGPGTYTVGYAIFDDIAGTFAFTVAQSAGPAEGVVPGPMDAALSKSTIVWVRVKDSHVPAGDRAPYEGGRDFPVWYGYEEGRIYVLVGEGEQEVPGLTQASTVRLIARSKDKQSQVSDLECACNVLDKNAEWERIAGEVLLGRRLNVREPATAIERWKETCEIVCLTPVPPPMPADTSASALNA